MIKVLVNGAAGKVGREVLKTIHSSEDTILAGAVDTYGAGMDAGTLMGAGESGMILLGDLKDALESIKPQVMVDFTNPQSVFKNTITALQNGVRPVVGTTGLTAGEIKQITAEAAAAGLGCIIAPNFAVGALLMIKFAAQAAKFFPHVEIIELHHDKKLDAPSGTAIKTAQAINEQRGSFRQEVEGEEEKSPCARGASLEGIRLHSVRLPGLVAHQEVLFGGLGQTLSIRHDSISRESFMPGVLLAVRKVMELEETVCGLENIIFE